MRNRISNQIPRALLALGWLILASGCSLTLNRNALDTEPIAIPGSEGSIAFEDLVFDTRLESVIVPSAGTGKLVLISPDTLDIQVIEGFGPQGENAEIEITSAAAARGIIYAVDKRALKIYVIDPVSESIIGSAPVEATPEYIRFVPATNELWVTEPEKEQIEIFSAPTEDPFTPAREGVIEVPKGPTGLIIDRSSGLAYTNQSEISMTMVIQVQTRGILDQWGNGCSEARGLALDEERGYLFIACGEGKVVMMDSINDGNQIASQTYGGDVNAIAYNPRLQHIYLPSGASAILAVFGITQVDPASGTATASGESSAEAPSTQPGNSTSSGVLALVRLGTVDTALNATCVTIDDADGIWVCDPINGRLLLAQDTFPASNAGS